MKSSSATLLFPNDWPEHLLREFNVQMMQLELWVAEWFPQAQDHVVSP